VIQKLILYFGIPKGELLNDPDIGCCLHNYIFDKITETTLINIMNEMEYELKVQIPELGVHRVLAATTDTRDAVMLQIIGYSTWSLVFSRNDLLDQNLLDIFGRNT
jgi:phage baseplate assembly protein W